MLDAQRLVMEVAGEPGGVDSLFDVVLHRGGVLRRLFHTHAAVPHTEFIATTTDAPPHDDPNTRMVYARSSAHSLGRVDAELGEMAAVVNSLLRDRIKAQKLTQKTVAAHAGISQPQLSRLLSGARDWDVDTLSAVCEALGTRASDMLAVAEDLRGGGA